jgi:DNA polymerase-3 subunit delta'
MTQLNQSGITAPNLPYPWHLTAWQQLDRSWQTQRFPHALLLHGMPGLGKYSFAQWLARTLLCEVREQGLISCGECASCKLNQAGSHPDFIVVKPEEDKTQISVDQIRAANESLTLTSTRNGYRVAIIEPAHQMTIAAANSLLKTLEEPNPNTLIIMVSSQPGSLLPTLRSRCQQLGIRVPPISETQYWLQQQLGKSVSNELLGYAGGAPLRVLEIAQGPYELLRQSMLSGLEAVTKGTTDIAQVAHSWADDQMQERLRWLEYWLSGAIRQKILKTVDSFTPVIDGETILGANLSAMYRSLDKIREVTEQLRRTSLQRELVLMSLLMRIQQSIQIRV